MNKYSTQKNIIDIAPQTNENNITCRYIKYPDNTSKRQAEGGLRLRNKYKNSIEKKPLVSVITVCFNSEKYLERCILSVLNQSYDNIEYIIIDGASTDNTLNIIKKYEHAIDYYVSEPDCGIYYAMNKGLELASGDYIAMLSSDDYYYDFAVSTSVNKLLDTNADMTAAYVDIVNDNKEIIRRHFLHYFDDTAYITGIPACHETMFIKKKWYEKIGYYDTSFEITADTNWIFDAIESGIKCELIYSSILAFKQGGISSSLDKMWFENACILSKRFPDVTIEDLIILLKFTNGCREMYDFNYAYNLILKHKFSLNQRYFIASQCIEVRPETYRAMMKFINTFSSHFFYYISYILPITESRGFIIITLFGMKISIKKNKRYYL